MQFVEVSQVNREYPIEDFISEKFDIASNEKLTDLILILTTPRSGSTLLCDLIYRASSILGHEYFQPHGYIQHLARRWKAYDKGLINPQLFINSIITQRAFDGKLCINLHGSHISLFSKFIQYFPSCTVKTIFLKRKYILPQAVSFAIAHQTGAWSSAYEPNQNAINYNNINTLIDQKIAQINSEQTEIEKFLRRSSLNHFLMYFEDLIEGHNINSLSEYLGININIKNASLKKQSNATSIEIMNNFVNA